MLLREPAEWVEPGIPAFAPKPFEDRRADPYDRDFQTVDAYTGFAFGHQLFGDGSGEGLYRTVDAFLLGRRSARSVLDVGCGVGRTLYDCAPLLSETAFTGLDYSYNMCLRAARILKGAEAFPLTGWERRGRPGVVFRSPRQLPNVSLMQGSAEDLPFAPMSFDAAVATLVLCRLRDPRKGLAEMVRVLKPGGRLLLATPLNFGTAENWERFVEPSRLRSELQMLGLSIDEWFDGLRYREVIDAHGNAHEYNVRIISATLAF
ncbi:MAG: class I SAM-dependent methyltransferase [Bryobacterales bacterium]|nr:class I SAM-dependent methyltransferase [Bryobacterales bacterium]